MTTTMITGIGGRLAALVAGALARQPGARVVGVDPAAPQAPVAGVEIACAELRGPALLDLLRDSAAEVVVHLAQIGEEQPADGREAAVQGNVLATMELLGACVAAGVRRVVLRSSTLVYGARHDLPAFAVESTPLCTTLAAGLPHNYVEVERFVAEFAASHPRLELAVLRCAGLVGGGVGSPLARYLAQPTPATLLGFDPRIQVLHPDDAAAAFALAAAPAGPIGPLNIAAADPLTLTHAIQLAGHRALPLPGALFDAAHLLGRAQWPGALPFDVDFLRYSCVADTRRAQAALGWQPQYSAEQALRELSPRHEVAAEA